MTFQTKKVSTLITGIVAATMASASLAATDGKVKIGVLADMSGTYADLCGPGCVVATRMAIDDFGGKVLGHDIELVSADSQLKPDIASAIARKWVENEGVDTIGGLVSSAVTGAVTQVTGASKNITLITGSASNAFTTSACSPYIAHWTYNVVALANGTVKQMVESGKTKWFFITADYAFGHALEGVSSKVIKENGGEVVGSVRAPLGTTDFSSYVLQAQASGADVVALANAGNDTVNALNAAAEFGLNESMDIAGLLVFTPNAQAMDPRVAQGMRLTTGFYWDMDDQTRAWSKRFQESYGGIPSMAHAGAYSATMHYLNAVAAVGTDDADAVMAQMKKTKPDDFFARNATLRADGRMVHDMLLVEIKKPSERKTENDIYKIVKVIPGDQAYNPMIESCQF
ncbi:ABC transporter substrate-binding protein [Maribrevibacterium harenarium]|uniref:ABC transporter substrate-binding protein n=1 Tax=Maribrevibacterium harenarium TaxID=2589817 RepID=A0A501WLM0_9GAMM|nr:ABC transporter substrate-binding protein [Maribrevibacterium harenarium]TPE48107.1 ABC transporter substrate-binding protein [Maribrevibacterium harenarium]